MVMSFKNGDIVKFDGNTEPCTVYRVLDETEVHMENEFLKTMCPHIKLEAIGMVPVHVLKEAAEHERNVTATNVQLHLSGQTN
jgi:hypothetical protein